MAMRPWAVFASGRTEMTDRRLFLLTMMLVLAAPRSVLAKDGDGGGKSGSDDGGRDGDDSGGKSRNRRGRDEDDEDDEDDDGDRDRIRKAVREGRARPLRDILELVRTRYKGQVVRVRLAGRSGRLVYRIRLIDPKNALIDVEVEAATGRIIKAAGV